MHLSRSHGGRWGATDIATLSLHFILYSDSLRASRRKTSKPVHQRCFAPNVSFVGPFFSLLALFLVKSSWQGLVILIHAQTILTCVSLAWLRCPDGLPDSVSDCTVSDVVSVWDAKQFLSHLISVACNFFRISAVNIYWVSRAYNSAEITRERISLIFEFRDICFSLQMVLSLASAAIVCAILNSIPAWNLDLWRLRCAQIHEVTSSNFSPLILMSMLTPFVTLIITLSSLH